MIANEVARSLNNFNICYFVSHKTGFNKAAIIEEYPFKSIEVKTTLELYKKKLKMCVDELPLLNAKSN